MRSVERLEFEGLDEMAEVDATKGVLPELW
jgi:hypothetical protein